MKKVTQLDAQILEFERKGDALSKYERMKLDNLRERKRLEVDNGINPKPSVLVPSSSPKLSKKLQKKSIKTRKNSRSYSHCSKASTSSLSVFNEDVSSEENVVEGSGEMHNINLSLAPGKKTSPFILFLQKKKMELREVEPDIKLDLAFVREEWGNLSASEREMYEKQALDIRERSSLEKVAVSSEEKRKRKAIVDKKYRDKKKNSNALDKEDSKLVKTKLEQIISIKKEKIASTTLAIESLQKEVHELKENLKSSANNLVKKDIELTCLKEQYKVLHKLHKTCTVY